MTFKGSPVVALMIPAICQPPRTCLAIAEFRNGRREFVQEVHRKVVCDIARRKARSIFTSKKSSMPPAVSPPATAPSAARVGQSFAPSVVGAEQQSLENRCLSEVCQEWKTVSWLLSV